MGYMGERDFSPSWLRETTDLTTCAWQRAHHDLQRAQRDFSRRNARQHSREI